MMWVAVFVALSQVAFATPATLAHHTTDHFNVSSLFFETPTGTGHLDVWVVPRVHYARINDAHICILDHAHVCIETILMHGPTLHSPYVTPLHENLWIVSKDAMQQIRTALRDSESIACVARLAVDVYAANGDSLPGGTFELESPLLSRAVDGSYTEYGRGVEFQESVISQFEQALIGTERVRYTPLQVAGIVIVFVSVCVSMVGILLGGVSRLRSLSTGVHDTRLVDPEENLKLAEEAGVMLETPLYS
jgi:hypothetical protein